MTVSRDVSRKKTPSSVLLLLSLSSLVFFLYLLWGFYHDDAYICLRYVQNFLQGNGLVWNIGERVEGYTSFLWTMLISFLGYSGLDLVLASRILGILFAFATLALFFLFERKNSPLGALLLATNSCFALWALGGLETTGFGFFLFLGCYLFLKDSPRDAVLYCNGLVFCLATMMRPEGLLFFGITVLWGLFKRQWLAPSSWKRAVLFVAGFASLYVPYFVWRFLYYGHLFPCTFYVKGGTSVAKIFFGSLYIYNFFIMFGGVPVLLLLLFVERWRDILTFNRYLLCLLLSAVVYVLFIGGDHMQGFRFFVPFLPLYYLFIQEALHRLVFSARPESFKRIAAILVLLNLFISIQSIPYSPKATIAEMGKMDRYKLCFKVPDPAAYIGKCVGLHMKENWPADSLVAVNTAGSTPYFSGLRCIDMLGLNDYTIARREMPFDNLFILRTVFDIPRLMSGRGIARIKQDIENKYPAWTLIPGHGKGDGNYVLSRKPDYIVIGPADGETDKPWFVSDKEILASPQFLKEYQKRVVEIPARDELHSYFWVTRSGSFPFTYYERKK